VLLLLTFLPFVYYIFYWPHVSGFFKPCVGHLASIFSSMLLVLVDKYIELKKIDCNKTLLEIWGRAQHEAARRPRYDLKYILGSCKLCKNLRDQHHRKGRIIVSRKVQLGGST